MIADILDSDGEELDLSDLEMEKNSESEVCCTSGDGQIH
jgi:hypothetical protein